MERRLTAILDADVVGYSRLMAKDEAGTLEAVKAIRNDLIERKIAEHQGRIVKLMGDGILAEFPSVVSAVSCAVAMQRAICERNSELPADRGIEFRIGINLGDVIVEDEDIHGDGVNIAARLQSIAPPGGIAISQSVRDHVGNRLNLAFQDRGEQQLKNIEKPIRVYDVLLEEPQPGGKHSMKDDRPSIAVLPFTNMSGDPEQEYFSDGITEDIITDLSKISGLFVTARHSAFSYKGKQVNMEQIGRELGVASVLEGSVRKAGSRVRVTAQLIKCADGEHLWAERFDRDLTDIFAIQDELTHAIVEQLKVKLLPQERTAIAQAQTDNVEAYTYYLRGREFFYRHSKHFFQLARRMFVKAVELDPRYARAYAGIADCDSFIFLHYNDGQIRVEDLLATTEKALALDDTLAEAHASRGVALSAANRYPEALQEFQQAIALNPHSYDAHYLLGRALFSHGEVERAAQHFEQAAEIRPQDYQCHCLLINVYRSLGRQEASLEAARKGVKLAEAELSLHAEDPRPAHLGIAALIELGETDRAREWISRALAIDPDDALTQYNVACGLTKLGDIDRALDLLERSLKRSGPERRAWVKHDSDFDPLRSHPRYQQMIALMDKGEL
jgi:adenylate cyclase